MSLICMHASQGMHTLHSLTHHRHHGIVIIPRGIAPCPTCKSPNIIQARSTYSAACGMASNLLIARLVHRQEEVAAAKEAEAATAEARRQLEAQRQITQATRQQQADLQTHRCCS